MQTVISNEKQLKNKALYYSIFILLNVNSLNTEISALKRFKQMRNVPPLSDSIRLLNYYLQGNYVRVFRIYKQLPLLCQLAFHRRIPSIEKYNFYSKLYFFLNFLYYFKQDQ